MEDVTISSQHIHFIQPLLLSEALAREAPSPWPQRSWKFRRGPPTSSARGCAPHGPEALPPWRGFAALAVPGLERPEGAQTLHDLGAYRGKPRRRPREFPHGLRPPGCSPAGPALRVVTTKDCEGDELENLGFMSLAVGDRLEVLGSGQALGKHERDLDVLVCQRQGEQTGEEEAWEDEEVA